MSLDSTDVNDVPEAAGAGSGSTRAERRAAASTSVESGHAAEGSSRGRRTDWRLGGRTVHPWRSQVLAVALLSVGLGVLLGTLVTVLAPSWGGLAATGVLWLGMLVPIVWAFARSRPAGLLRFRFSTCCGGSGSG